MRARSDLRLHPARELRDSAAAAAALGSPAARPTARGARDMQPRRRQCSGLGPPLGDRHPWSRAIPELQRVVRSMLFYLLCSADSGTGTGHPAHGALERRVLRPHLLGLRHLDVPLAPADPSGRGALAGGVPGAHACRPPEANARANGFRGAMYPWEADEQRQRDDARTSPCRTPAPRSTSTATSPWRSGSTTWPPATPPGWRARAIP